MRHLLLIFLCLLLLFSCRKPEACQDCPTPPDTTQTGPFKVLWQTPLNPDTAECLSMKPVLYNGNVLYSMLFYVDGYEFLRMRNAETGKMVWSWDPLWPGEVTPRGSRFVKDNLLLLTHWDPYYSIDLNTGQNVWAQNIGTDNTTGSPRISLVGDYLYAEHSDRMVLDTASYFVRANIYTGVWDTLFVKKLEDGYRPSLHPPVLWLSPQGDSVLIFQNRQWNFPASDGRIDLLAYNLHTRAFIWEVKDFAPEGNSSVEQPLIFDNKVYFLSEKSLYCIDAATGAIKWTWRVPAEYDNLLTTNILAAEGKIYIKPTNEAYLYGLEPNSGALHVTVANAGSGSVEMSYYNGIIYYSSQGDGKLYAIKPSTGKIIWHDYSPNLDKPGLAVFDPLVISPQQNCIFLGDRFFMMAIQLPE